MRLSPLCALLALPLSISALAQPPMPMANGNMGKPTMAKPMPENVTDNRQVVPLTEAERSLVATEMRQMLASVQGIANGLARGDAQAVVDAAAKSGPAMMQKLPTQIRVKFPPAFSQMGMATHMAFDQIARETKTVKDPAPVLRQLSGAMQYCIACHAAYRFASPQ